MKPRLLIPKITTLALLLLGSGTAVHGQTVTASAPITPVMRGGTAAVVLPSITVASGSNITDARVTISGNFISGDVLAAPTLQGGVTASYNSTTGVLSLTGTATATQWQAMFRAITFATTASSSLNRTVTFSIGNLVSGSNGHFYEAVSSSNISWTSAKTAAAGRTYLGLQGYLATITSQAENDLIYQKLSTDAWIGASDDYAQIQAAGVATFTSQGSSYTAGGTTSEGKWYWVTGPEKGTAISLNNNSPVAVNTAYMNWASGEPNNSGGTEHYGEIYSSGSPGQWNDLPNSNSINSYVVEYGGMSGDPVLAISTSKTLSITTMPVSGLQLWLDASDVNADGSAVPSSGTGINTWKDKSGGARNAVAQNLSPMAPYAGNTSCYPSYPSPKIYTNQINGKPVVRFTRDWTNSCEAEHDYGSGYNVPGVDIRATTMSAVTIFTVYKQGTQGYDQGLWGDDDGGWDRFFFTSWGTNVNAGINNGGASLGPSNPAQIVTGAGIPGQLKLMTAVYDYNVSLGSTIYFNGQSLVSFTDQTNPTQAQTSFRIGLDGDDNYFDGDIAEVMVYNRKLTACEIQQVNSYLSNKYAVVFSGVSISAGTPDANRYVTLSLSSTVAGATGYQWLRDGAVIGGATNNSYQATVTGNYRLIVTNACGADTSAALRVEPTRLYVNNAATGANNGTSWTNAYTNIQTAINAAPSGDTVLVAKGSANYQPASGQSFSMKAGVVILGGFAGTETLVSQRDWVNNITTLQGNNAVVIKNDGNSLTSSAILDGFTITGGNATLGGGFYNASVSPTLQNLVIRNNTATTQGGGMYNLNASPTIQNTVFASNTATNSGGGGTSSFGGATYTLTLNNVVFSGNTAAVGGAMDNNLNVVARNITFYNNRATGTTNPLIGGGAIFHNTATLTLTNAVFLSNTAAAGGNADIQNNGTANVSYCGSSAAFSGLSSSSNNVVSSMNPFINSASPIGADGKWFTSDDGLQLNFCSPFLNNGTNTGVTATDILGRPRIVSTTVDMGAYEKQSSATIDNNARLSTGSANALAFVTDACNQASGWTYYADPSQPDSLSFAIDWGGAANAAAKTAAKIYITVDNNNTAASTVAGGIWTMRRYWNVDLGAASLAVPVKVRFFFSAADTTAMRAAAAAWNTTYGGANPIGSIKWFKTVGNLFNPATQVTASNINNGNKVMLTPVYGVSNGISYAEFSNITSFSGGTGALGAGSGITPLPVKLMDFSARKGNDGQSVVTTWNVAEEDVVAYEVERSKDALSFEKAGALKADARGQYSFTDQLTRSWTRSPNIYYRLAMVEVDGRRSYSNTERVSFDGTGGGTFSVSPNPTTSRFTVYNNGSFDKGSVAVITDAVGRVISKLELDEVVMIDARDWTPGIYLMKLPDGTVQKLVKQ